MYPRARASFRPSRVAGQMNKLEASYASHLALLKNAGEIHDYKYEPVKLRLAVKTGYTPDFMVIMPDGTIVFHEVKGFWEDDARVKAKVIAEMYPWFFFKAITRKKSQWITEEF
jgi:hypothetical protein